MSILGFDARKKIAELLAQAKMQQPLQPGVSIGPDGVLHGSASSDTAPIRSDLEGQFLSDLLAKISQPVIADVVSTAKGQGAKNFWGAVNKVDNAIGETPLGLRASDYIFLGLGLGLNEQLRMGEPPEGRMGEPPEGRMGEPPEGRMGEVPVTSIPKSYTNDPNQYKAPEIDPLPNYNVNTAQGLEDAIHYLRDSRYGAATARLQQDVVKGRIGMEEFRAGIRDLYAREQSFARGERQAAPKKPDPMTKHPDNSIVEIPIRIGDAKGINRVSQAKDWTFSPVSEKFGLIEQLRKKLGLGDPIEKIGQQPPTATIVPQSRFKVDPEVAALGESSTGGGNSSYREFLDRYAPGPADPAKNQAGRSMSELQKADVEAQINQAKIVKDFPEANREYVAAMKRIRGMFNGGSINVQQYNAMMAEVHDAFKRAIGQ